MTAKGANEGIAVLSAEFAVFVTVSILCHAKPLHFVHNSTVAIRFSRKKNAYSRLLKFWICQKVPSEQLLLVTANQGTRFLVPAFSS
jgi:hypothetical protein